MSIVNLIVHEVQKKSGEESTLLIARPSENTVEPQAQTLADHVSGLFNRSGMSTGRFTHHGGQAEGARLPALLLEHFHDNHFKDFVAFSKACAVDFVKYIKASQEAEGGLLWFNHYVLHDTHFLYIVLLKRKQGLMCDADLSLAQIEQIEVEKLHMALRINLTAWCLQDDSRYIAFRTGKASRSESDYFTAFIGCNEAHTAAKETRKLVDLTAAFCQEKVFSPQQSNELKRVVVERCLEKLEENEPLELAQMASEIEERFTPGDTGRFLELATSEAFAMEKQLFVEKSALKKLVRYSGSNRALTLSFDSDLLGQSIRFDEANGSLVISDLPKTLLKQLKQQH